MINILPEPSRRKAVWEYRRRLLVEAMFLMAALGAICALALTPSYLQSREAERSAVQEAALTAENIADPSLSRAAADEESAEKLLEAVENSSAPRPSAILDLFAAARAPGIILRSFVYAGTAKRATLALGGVADTREHLLALRSALQNIPGVSGADFPPAVLAASSTITFSIKMNYAPPAQNAGAGAPRTSLSGTSTALVPLAP